MGIEKKDKSKDLSASSICQGNLSVALKDNMFYEQLLNDVKEDFTARQNSRRPYELAWQLNMNFLMGNQYCNISGKGDIEQEDKFFFWQEREVYNHIAPIVETRIAKLSRVRPTVSVRPFSNSDSDVNSAKVSSKVLQSTAQRVNLDKMIASATLWSEVCGTSFYKVSWDSDSGKCVGSIKEGDKVFEGDVSISVCPPFEIYPDSNASSDIEDCSSIIHAKAYSVQDVKLMYGVDVCGEDVRIFSLDNTDGVGGLGYNSSVPSITQQVKKDHVVVIEKYIKPDRQYLNGRLIVVAGDKILLYTELPYVCGEQSARGFPFIRQVANEQAGCFWGVSVIERIIPVQRSYNAVKNRKHEFLNRIAMGVLTVEDGSVDTENLEEEGLSPGKVLVYRQGSTPPRMMDAGHVPTDFMYEEERLLNEFVVISGVSELMRNSQTPTNVTSGVALQLLIDQDNTRLSFTAEDIRRAVKQIAKMILRLFKQFATTTRLTKVLGEDNRVEMFYFSGNEISSDDVTLDTENELNNTPSQQRALVFELLKAGLLTDDNGKISQSSKVKLLDMIGFGSFNNAQDIAQLHIKRATSENLDLVAIQPLDIDDHQIHIDEHTKFIISNADSKQNDKIVKKLLQHIQIHKDMLADSAIKTGLLVKQLQAE